MTVRPASDPKRVLVTGANGFIGSHVIEALLTKGYSLKAVARNALLNSSPDIEMITADLSLPIAWEEALVGVSTIIHLAARVHQMNEAPQMALDEYKNINTRATLELAEQAAKAGVNRFIYLSTMAVNGAFTLPEQSFTEVSTPCPQSSYAISKYEAELGLQKIARQYPMEVVIIRPPMVYGANAPGNFSKLVSLINTRIPLPFGCANNLRSFIFIGNLVSFIESCINHPAAGNELFLASDADDVALCSMIEQISRNLKLTSNIFPLPLAMLEGLLILLGRRGLANQLLKPMRIDISKAQSLLGWIPPYTAHEGLIVSVNG
jgi:nucleoside-diphosphate-sugar epimerase